VLDVEDHRIVVQTEDSTHPGQVLEYTIEDGALSEPERAELRGTGDLATNLFNLRDVALDKLPDLLMQAAVQVDAQDGKVTRLVVRRQLPQTDAVRLRVYVESPRLSGYADFDASGTPLPDGPS
jgi:hypothetical protein